MTPEVENMIETIRQSDDARKLAGLLQELLAKD
jgi:hypothetical protein